MDTFFGENAELDNTGTNDDPLIAGWIRGKFNDRGKKFVHKIEDVFYAGMVKRELKENNKS